MVKKTMLCALCVSAVMSMLPVPAAAEAQLDDNDIHIQMLGADESGDESSRATLKEQTRSHWQIYACTGAGAIVVISVISLLADNKKKVDEPVNEQKQ